MACCAAATDCGRPTVIGSMIPGKSTAFRTPTMMSASGGRGAMSTAVLGWRGALSSATARLRFSQGDHQATGHHRATHIAVLAGRERQPPLEAALRHFEPVDSGAAELQRQDPRASNHEIAVLDHHLGALRLDSRQGNDDEYFLL